MAEGKKEKRVIFFDDNPQNIHDMLENVPNCRTILVDTDTKHRFIKKYVRKIRHFYILLLQIIQCPIISKLLYLIGTEP